MENDGHHHDTARINVGGRHYEVSTSLLLERNPDSMLATLLSDTWREDPCKPIFIDRDGDMFAHVLNYMRYGSIELPSNLPKAMFERELDFYGLTIYEESIQQSTSVATMKLWKSRIAESELHHDMLVIATKCYGEFMSGRTTVRVGSRTKLRLRNGPYSYDENVAMDTLNYYLLQFYGLTATLRRKLYVVDLDWVLKVQEFDEEKWETPKEIQVSSSTEPSVGPEDGSTASSSNPIGPTFTLRGDQGQQLSNDEFLAAVRRSFE